MSSRLFVQGLYVRGLYICGLKVRSLYVLDPCALKPLSPLRTLAPPPINSDSPLIFEHSLRRGMSRRLLNDCITLLFRVIVIHNYCY